MRGDGDANGGDCAEGLMSIWRSGALTESAIVREAFAVPPAG